MNQPLTDGQVLVVDSTQPSGVSAVDAEPIPTGTGFRHTTGGVEDAAAVALDGDIVAVFDGGESSPPAGKKCWLPRVPFNCTIKSARMVADQAGSAVITVKKSSYAGFPTTASIVASAPPTLTSAQKSEDATLTGWTTALAKGDVLEFILDSASTLTWVSLELAMERTET